MRYTPEDICRALQIYAVTDNALLCGRSLKACVQQALAGGATFVQLRHKEASTAQLIQQATQLLPMCRAAKVPLVVNDDVEAALRSGADGVHVGQTDAACTQARAVLGKQAIVGVSVQTVAQAREAQAAGADYLGVGAIFATPTKPDAATVSLDTLRKICSAVHIPVVAIGGLDATNISQLAGSGIAGVAVVSAIFAARDIETETKSLHSAVRAIMK